MCEQRTPLKSGSVVLCRAADKFVSAIGFFDETGGAEDGDEAVAYAMEKAEI